MNSLDIGTEHDQSNEACRSEWVTINWLGKLFELKQIELQYKCTKKQVRMNTPIGIVNNH